MPSGSISIDTAEIKRSRLNSASVVHKYVEPENTILRSTNVTTTVNIMHVFFKPKQNTIDK